MVNVRMLVGKGLIFGVLMAAPQGAIAEQEKPSTATEQPRLNAPKRVMKAGNLERRMQHLTVRLDLTEEQRAQVRPILEEEAVRINALRVDDTLSRVQRRAKLQEIRDDMYERINTVLTPEQQKKHDELRKTALKQRKQR